MTTSQMKLRKSNAVGPILARFFAVRDIVGSQGIRLLALSALIGVSLSLAEAAVALMIQLVLISLGMATETPSIPGFLTSIRSPIFIAIVFVLVGVLRTALQTAASQTGVSALVSVTTRLRQICLRYMIYDPSAKWPSATEIHFLFSEAFQKTGELTMHAAQQVPLIIQASGITFLLFTLSPRLSGFGVIGIVIVGALVSRLNRRVKARSSNLPKEHKKLLRGIDRVTKNWIVVNVFQTKDQEFLSLSSHVASYAHNQLKAKWFVNLSQAVPQCLGVMILALMLYIKEAVGGLDGATFIAFLYLFLRFSTTLGQIVTGIGNITNVAPSMRFTADFIEKVKNEMPICLVDGGYSSIPSILPAKSQPSPVTTKPPAIEFRNVTFCYTTGRNVLNDFSLTIPAGSQVGILGRSGSGKSTLLGLALGLTKPQEGEVLLNGIDPTSFYDDPNIRVGYVGPDPFLIAGTVRDNLVYGLPFPPSNKAIDDAVRKAAFDRDLQRLPTGLDHFISENGEGLSAGQKQRLSIARSLLRNPCILVFDEATSNLDRTTENEIKNTINALRGSATMLVVTHRPELIDTADQVVNLEFDQQMTATEAQ